MTNIKRQPLPRLDGPVTREYLELVFREMLARFDARNPQNDFADGLVASGTGVTLGNGARPVGRTASVAALVNRIANNGQASDQRFLPIVNAGNRLSAQTTNPLSSSGSPSTASITIGSHVVQYGFGTVAYNGGTISGLTPLTTYHVYALDPEYEGGAVSYAATTTPATVVSSNDHYYVGEITTANSSPSGNVTGATSANPTVLTTTLAATLTSGQSVVASEFTGDFAALNANTYVVTVLSSSTLSIPVNASAFAAWAGGGTLTRVSTPVTGSGGGGGWGKVVEA